LAQISRVTTTVTMLTRWYSDTVQCAHETKTLPQMNSWQHLLKRASQSDTAPDWLSQVSRW